MKTALALVVFVCGAASAAADTSRYVQPYCSTGFDKPAKISAEGVVTIGGKAQSGDSQRPAEIILASGERQHVIIFRDRVFWPCK